MPYIEMPGGGYAHICIRGQRHKRCSFCTHGYVDKLCDFPVGPGKKTCDAGMCSKCATAVSPDIDHCPSHKGKTPAQGALAL